MGSGLVVCVCCPRLTGIAEHTTAPLQRLEDCTDKATNSRGNNTSYSGVQCSVYACYSDLLCMSLAATVVGTVVGLYRVMGLFMLFLLLLLVVVLCLSLLLFDFLYRFHLLFLYPFHLLYLSEAL